MSRLTSMPRNARLVAFVVPILWATVTPCQSADIYKSVDAQGHVVYSDRNSAGAQKADVQVPGPHDVDIKRLAKDQAALQKQEAQRSAVQREDERSQALKERERRQACELARVDYYRLRDARHVVYYDEQGKRSFYSDKEADAHRAEALQSMQSACD